MARCIGNHGGRLFIFLSKPSRNQPIQTVSGKTRLLTANVRYAAFNFPRSDDLGIVSVSLTLEKALYGGRRKALQMSSERVRVMN